jgi:acyl-CoA dehydrogenase
VALRRSGRAGRHWVAQVFGGRDYLRTNVAERFSRELRVDRIWEGTPEIQRLVVARGVERRGVEIGID